MSHLDSSTLATYNSLIDPHLQCYFSNERIRTHLKHAGLISRRGEIVSDSEYRLKLARRDQKKHVRQMLAENIVHRAIDMERTRQAELRRHLDVVSKAALVNTVKESRRRGGYSSRNVSNSNDVGILSIHSSWSQSRPKSASQHQEIEIINEEVAEQPRVQSAHNHDDHRRKHSSKSPNRRSRYLSRPKSSSVQRLSPSQRPRSPIKPSDSSVANPPCQITMVYYGPHTKVDYDHSLFEPVDEIMVMQQHCGGENLIVYKDNLKAGDEFTFNSRRHSDFPFGLSLYVKGLIDSRISTCCEYKHRHGVRLGGERGHFAIVSVQGSKACLKCRFEKQGRLKRSADLNETDDENKKPITISIPASDEQKIKQTPVKIPVRHSPELDENYSEDFDGSDRVEKQKTDHSSDSDRDKNKIQPTQLKSPSETSLTSTIKSDETSSTKTWQIIFHTSNIPTGSLQLPKNPLMNVVLKFSFISLNGKDETEQHEIQIKDFPQCFKSGGQDSFRAKLQNLGKPKQIRLQLQITGDDDEEIKWHLNHIELIDPESQSHYKFPCNQWIRSFEEKILNHSDYIRKSSTSTNSSKSSIRKKQSPTVDKKSKTSSRSSSLSNEFSNRFELIQKPVINQTRRISTDNDSNDQQNKIHYRIIITPSKDHDGEFNALNDSRIFIRLNDQTKDSFLYKKDTKHCPSFESGENQTFEMDLRQNMNEQPTKLTIGYYNTDITAGKWKLQKVILINTETGEETIFPCKESLKRNDFNLRAEQTFQAQSKQSDDDEDDDRQSTPRHVNVVKPVSPESESEEDIQQEQVQSTTINQNRSSSSESTEPTIIQNKNINEKPPSRHSSENLNDDDDDDNEYNRMFKKNNLSNKDKLTASESRPKTRRGLEDTFDKENEQGNTSNKNEVTKDIWRPSSELNKEEPVDPLVGLDDLQNQTARSNDQKDSSSTSNHTENQFKDWYPTSTDDDKD